MTYGNGATVSYEYDDLDRVVYERWNGTRKYQYFYNTEGNLSKKLDLTTGKAVNYEYDTLGRLIYSWQTSGGTLLQKTAHLYDTENRIVSQSWQLGTTPYSESYSYDADDGSLSTMTPAVGGTITFAYDALKRLQSRTNGIYAQSYGYRDITTNVRTTTQVTSLSYAKAGTSSLSGLSFTYAYDNLGNIASVNSGVDAWDASYTYDQLGQLKTEENSYGNYTYTYDTAGNILSVKNTDTNALIHSYTYGDSTWLDKLTAFDDETITYDAIGNPISYYNGTRWTFGWSNGRQLTSASKSGTSISYTYDVAGIRDSKTVNGTTYTYLTQNGQVVRQTGGGNTLDFIYDNQGKPYALVYNGTTYYYILNLQGDVVQIVTSTGTSVATYTYDAWGAIINSWCANNYDVGDVNPIRYRGYYYDTETGLYYLQSRYYDPVVKRFINADGYYSTGNKFVGYNMYAYCNNNPVNYADSTGTYPDWVYKYFGTEWNYIQYRNQYEVPSGTAQRKPSSSSSSYSGGGSFAIYDNHNHNPYSKFHEQMFAVEFEGPGVSIGDGERNLSLGSASFAFMTGGWDIGNANLSLLDFGCASAELNLSGGVEVECKAAIYSPSFSFQLGRVSVTIGADIGAVGFSFSRGLNELSIGVAGGVGGSISVEW